MLIINNNDNDEDLNDFWLDNNIINCCDVVKHNQTTGNTKSVYVNYELYDDYKEHGDYKEHDTYKENSKKLNNNLTFNYHNNSYVNKKYNIQNQRNQNPNYGNFRANNLWSNFGETTNRNQNTNHRVSSKKITYTY